MINLFTIFFVILLLFGAAAVDGNTNPVVLTLVEVFESPKRAEMEKYAGPRQIARRQYPDPDKVPQLSCRNGDGCVRFCRDGSKCKERGAH